MITPHVQSPDAFQPRQELRIGTPRVDLGSNIRYQEILRSLNGLLCFKTAEPIVVGVELANRERKIIRPTDAYAVKTIITNLGPWKVTVYEAGHIIAIIQGRGELELPMGGKLRLEASSANNNHIAVTTYRREICGFPRVILESDQVPEGSEWL